LKLDEQSFQGLLAAAFTIQEHNDKKKRTSPSGSGPESVPAVQEFLESHCPQCAAPLQAGETSCHQCGSDQFRPGERMQRKFASLWEMSQEQGIRRDPGNREEALVKADASGNEALVEGKDEIRIVDVQEELQENAPPEESDWYSRFPELKDLQLAPSAESELDGDETAPRSALARMISHVLDFPRADLYLGLAILVAVVALMWPAPASPQRAHLRPWQRILVSMGIAEAPSAAVHYRGNPNAQVWVDPHTALYYCQNEEQFGKTANGRYTDQREAQLEQFEPAGRSVCP